MGTPSVGPTEDFEGVRDGSEMWGPRVTLNLSLRRTETVRATRLAPHIGNHSLIDASTVKIPMGT